LQLQHAHGKNIELIQERNITITLSRKRAFGMSQKVTDVRFLSLFISDLIPVMREGQTPDGKKIILGTPDGIKEEPEKDFVLGGFDVPTKKPPEIIYNSQEERVTAFRRLLEASVRFPPNFFL
jgi:hypothetical protein